jgi:hypothetical protein
MKFAIASAVSLAALALAAAGPAAARDPIEVEIEHAVARVVVIVEDRADVGVEIEQGSAGLPQLRVRREDGHIEINGGLGRRIGGIHFGDDVRNCRSGPDDARQPGEGASVEVRRVGRIDMARAPLIVIRTPRAVDVSVGGGAVWGSVGRGATSVSVGNGGCGDWTVANVDGALELAIMGSGDFHAGTSRSLSASIMGSGNVFAGATGAVEASIAGSGNIDVARMDGGDFEANIMGSGDILVRAGTARRAEGNIMGSGDITFQGTAGTAEGNVMGSGDIRFTDVTGAVERSTPGSGSVIVGR